jgi:dipeptidyl-peptidase-4
LKKRFLFFVLLTLCLSVSGNAQKKEYTLQAVQKFKEMGARALEEAQWIDNGRKFTMLKYDTLSRSKAIFIYDVEKGKESFLLDKKSLDPGSGFEIDNYQWSPNQKYILFTGKLTARSLKTGGSFYIYDLETKRFRLLASGGEQMNATFSPDGKKLAFVRDNNIFVTDILSLNEKQLTFDGSPDILNGHSDWVYEEEFKLINCIQWAPDSRSLAFWRFDQSQVPLMQIAKWDSLHFNFLTYHYPKPGDRNSVVKIGIVGVENGNTVWADIGNEQDVYIPRAQFTADAGVLSVQRLNRLQNELELLFVDANTGASKTTLTETDSCWIEIEDMPVYLKDGKSFLWLSTKDGYSHIYRYDYSGRLINRVTQGEWEVMDYLGVDENTGRVFYTSNERGTIYKDFYSVGIDGAGKTRITAEAGYHSITLFPGGPFYFDRYSNANRLPETGLFRINGEKVRDFIKQDMSAFDDYGFSKMEFIKFKTTDGAELNASVIKPAGFDKTKKYPVLIANYSGPGSQSVLDQWNRETWHQMLAQKGYIIFTVDCRGTGGRGKAFRNLAYKRLGYWEPNDNIEAAKYLASLGYVDKERIGIWGWSYGGYASALTLCKGADYFKAAIAVAPVTDWRFYDDIYTERYMSLPELNKEGYQSSSVMQYAGDLKGKFLLVHGTADDNVHFQNSVKLVEKLISENKQFRTMYYPEKEHSIRGGATRYHLYRMLTDFILDNL